MVKARPETHRRSARIAELKGRRQKSVGGKALTRAKKTHCLICSEICRMLALPLDSDEQIETDTWSDVVFSFGCKVHPYIFQHACLGYGIEGGDIDKIYLRKVASRPSIKFAYSFHSKKGIILSDSRLTMVPCTQSPYGYGKTMHDQWIDLGLPRRWISTCEILHASTCQSGRAALDQHTTHPKLLIDTWRMCLKYAAAGDSYVALSYVWGQCETLKTTKANLESLLKDQALSSITTQSAIPRTIMDAMKLLGVINKRYLWVDCLCIVQDDFAGLQHQLNSMASVYANAQFTIIAADGKDATHGLRGIPGVSEARSYRQKLVCFSRSHKAMLSRELSATQGSSWSKRGWVFQEDVFSQRRLVFHNDMVRWECSRHTLTEEYEIPEQPHNNSDPYEFSTSQREQMRALLSQSWPNLATYSSLVESYNLRELTFPGDVIAAFDGLTSRIGSSFDGGFSWGLPEMFFDVALLWIVDDGRSRRTALEKSSSQVSIPSWTWMAFEGSFKSISWDSGSNYFWDFPSSNTSPDVFDTIPILQWYTFERNSGQKRPIQSTWRKYINCRDGEAPPPEWELHKDSAGCISYFRHRSIPNVRFHYPIPIQDQPETEAIKVASDLIACCAQRAYLTCPHGPRSRRAKGLRDKLYSLELLSGKQKEWMGALHLDDDQSSMPVACELIAISAGRESNSGATNEHIGWVMDPKLHSRSVFEFFNVLSIEWKDGIAYRTGVGKVLKEKWEALELEWIDVVLG